MQNDVLITYVASSVDPATDDPEAPFNDLGVLSVYRFIDEAGLTLEIPDSDTLVKRAIVFPDGRLFINLLPPNHEREPVAFLSVLSSSVEMDEMGLQGAAYKSVVEALSAISAKLGVPVNYANKGMAVVNISRNQIETIAVVALNRCESLLPSIQHLERTAKKAYIKAVA